LPWLLPPVVEVDRGQIQHAPGRFHSGAQVVKETEQATVAPCGRGVAANPGPCPVSAAGFRST